jgi:hypothetical protein
MELIKQICSHLLEEDREIDGEKYPLLEEKNILGNWKECYIELSYALLTIQHPQVDIISKLFIGAVYGSKREPEYKVKRNKILQILSQNPEALIPLDLLE